MSGIEKGMFLDLRYYLGENLMTKVDRASMMHSLEVRTPFLDYRFVEFASRLPVGMKLHGLRTKYILKKRRRRWSAVRDAALEERFRHPARAMD